MAHALGRDVTGETVHIDGRGRRLRVERARLLIQEGASDLASVALEAGFADQSHFTRVFRRLVGTTPGEYRRSARR